MKKRKAIILKEGETTGHAHKILTEVEYNEDEKKLTTFNDTDILHEEHDTITIPKKKSFSVDDVVEYDPIAEEIRRVQD